MSRFSFLRGERGEHLVALQFVIFFGFIVTPAWNPLVTPGLLEMLAPLRWPALLLCWGAALALGIFGALHIRDYLTPLPYPVDHNQLVKHGAYARVRHPLYSSQLFAAAGWVLFTLSLSHLLILILGFVFFDYKASKEEAWLSERHPEYAAYASQVRKLIPWIY
ncbi:protein-S-isoprenylcysteine methyltransferase [Thiocapsa imhoffii]|uniref:Protein-S-isoprenylcysteine methyltransferase n=1 Tax=Thiocapsa imhoffii TaxID=382777 RepID=A0A9X1B8N3_9GAMM|nr:methyltransferase [Thiocapsa imhoffii]MBK1644433.1 protein-S-isoprenylcysteine methyltransferase [Thiocapsa imhoffii]